MGVCTNYGHNYPQIIIINRVTNQLQGSWWTKPYTTRCHAQPGSWSSLVAASYSLPHVMNVAVKRCVVPRDTLKGQ